MEEINLEKELVDNSVSSLSSPPTLRELVINFMAKHSLYLIQENQRQSQNHQTLQDGGEGRPRRHTCHCTPQWILLYQHWTYRLLITKNMRTTDFILYFKENFDNKFLNSSEFHLFFLLSVNLYIAYLREKICWTRLSWMVVVDQKWKYI